MKISNLHLHYDDSGLESRQITLRIISAFKRKLQQVIQYLTSGDELQVWTKRDRYGKITWQAYDPISDRRVVRESEAEMRAWVEKRYYY
jgi:hypothetical protein